MRYQFRNLDGSPLTAQQVAALNIPAFVPPETLNKPIYPLYTEYAFEARYRADMTEQEVTQWRSIWDTYWADLIHYKAAKATADAAYFKQFTDFQAVLQAQFVFFTGAWDGHVWTWSLKPGVTYTFRQASERLIKYSGPGTVQGFLLTGYFGF